MTPEQIAQIIVLVLAGLFGGGGAGLAVTRARNAQTQRNFRVLFQEATEKLVKYQERIEELETVRDKQTLDITDIKARLTVLNEERDKERKIFQTERDEVMMERGKITAQLEVLQREIDQMRIDLKEVRAKNDELQRTNKQLEEYREVAREQKRQLDEANKRMQQHEATIQGLRDQIRILQSRLNPDPPPSSAIDPEKKASGE